MGAAIFKTNLMEGDLEVHALGFLPDPEKHSKINSMALFTHGYTSHKGSLLTWASRLVEEGVAVLIFDLPGHYLGGFFEVESFDSFKSSAHRLFCSAHKILASKLPENEFEQIILGGHSLGALLSLNALNDPYFADKNCRSICVGLGVLEEGKTHLFETPFYKSTLVLREQLVSPELSPEKVFSWIREEKHRLAVKNKIIHMITGEDDLVVGDQGSERIAAHLKSLGNMVSLEKPTKLPHHFPEQAASFIKKYFRKENLL